MDTRTDEQLLAAAKGGDEDALSELLLRHGPGLGQRMDGQIGSRWRSILAADDVMQVTYLEAFLRINTLSATDVAQFVAWLKRIAENNLRDAIRHLEAGKRPNPSNRVQAGPTEDSKVSFVEMLAANSQTPSKVVAAGEAVNWLYRELENLPADYAKVVREYDLGGRPVEHVAAELGRSPGAVYMLRARAHDRLQELMGGAGRFFSQG
jgi:RNA polymerase sigma-70 factor, ECF subfamily